MKKILKRLNVAVGESDWFPPKENIVFVQIAGLDSLVIWYVAPDYTKRVIEEKKDEV